MFINRETELDLLQKQYQEKRANLVIIYGRRRVGKTTLIKEFIKDKPNFYFLADKTRENILQKAFQKKLAQFLNDQLVADLKFKTWYDIFDYFLKQAHFKQKTVLVIDEFQYLAQGNSAFPSILQKIWDEQLSQKNIFLILCGSLISLMYKTTLNYKSPLYGRRTGDLNLKPISFKDYQNFYPHSNSKRLVEFYSVTGGVPKYIEVFQDKNLEQNIKTKILQKGSYLYNEPRFILNEELSQTTTYFSLLSVIAAGEHKIGKIASKVELPVNHLSKYLNVLIDLDIIRREVPVTEKNPAKSKKGLYFIHDNFFRFWFRYVFPSQGDLELGRVDHVWQGINSSFSQFVSFNFEQIIQELAWYWSNNLVPFKLKRLGKWWNHQEEIDMVALNPETKEILFGEVKWQNRLLGERDLIELKRKSQSVAWGGKNRKEYFILVSKEGFQPKLKQMSKEQGIILVGFDKNLC